MGSSEALRDLLSQVGLPPERAGEVELRGADPILPTRFRIGEAASAALGAIGLVVSDIWGQRGGSKQAVRVDAGAAAASLLSFAHQRLEEGEIPIPDLSSSITDLYPTRDGKWYLLHQSFPKTTEATLALLACGGEKQQVASAVASWDAQALEDAMAERGLCGARVRTAQEWRAHPQGRALEALPVVEVLRVGASPPEPFTPGRRPLEGTRILDLTRVLAGPACGRMLAEHGAEVLRVGSPDLPSIPFFVMDTSHGKRSAHLDLTSSGDAERLRALVREADVFTQGYRLGAIERLGFGPEALHALRPGLIYTTLNCYGHEGPWSGRPGWEQLAQTVTGIAAENGEPDTPRLLPAAATDYTTGYLAALGTLIALERRAREGGSYLVRASLSQTGMWIERKGRTEQPGAGLGAELLDPLLSWRDTPFGRLRHLRPVLELSETPPHWELPTVPLGTHPPAWT